MQNTFKTTKFNEIKYYQNQPVSVWLPFTNIPPFSTLSPTPILSSNTYTYPNLLIPSSPLLYIILLYLYLSSYNYSSFSFSCAYAILLSPSPIPILIYLSVLLQYLSFPPILFSYTYPIILYTSPIFIRPPPSPMPPILQLTSPTPILSSYLLLLNLSNPPI